MSWSFLWPTDIPQVAASKCHVCMMYICSLIQNRLITDWYFTYCLDWSNFNFHQCYGLKFKILKKSCYHSTGRMAEWNHLKGTTYLKLALISFWQKSGQNWLNGGHFKNMWNWYICCKTAYIYTHFKYKGKLEIARYISLLVTCFCACAQKQRIPILQKK